MKLRGRLKLVADKVPPSQVVCDVGTDHAYVPIYLIENRICGRAIASDVRKGPLDIARRNIEQSGLSEYIETRLGSGLTVLYPGEADTVVIAGMGGELIINLFRESEQVARKTDTFVLQPMNSIELLREWLYGNGYTVYDEELVLEGRKLYNVITVKNGHQDLPTPLEIDVGKMLIEKKDPLLPVLLERKINKINVVLNSIGNMDGKQLFKSKLEEKKEGYLHLLGKIRD